MSEYATFIAYISMVIAGFTGLVGLIGDIIYYFKIGNAVAIALSIIFSEVLVVVYGIIPFISWFVFLFLVGLPFYGVYKLFHK